MQLEGTVGVLTGASRGLGVAIAEHLARAGVHLALAARSEAGLDQQAQRLRAYGVRVLPVPTDVTDPDQLERLVERTTAELGPIGLLVNNAGIELYRFFEDYTFQEIEAIVKTNLVAAQWLTKLVLPGMIERRCGHVVNVASAAGKIGEPYNLNYCASKHGLVGFTWGLRAEMRERATGVSASVVCPTFVSGQGMFHDWSRGARPPVLARATTPEKVAAAVVRAVVKDRAEIIVAPGLGALVDVVHALSPDLGAALLRRSGVYRFLRQAVHQP
jgi:short-subunit dehydrogenase